MMDIETNPTSISEIWELVKAINERIEKLETDTFAVQGQIALLNNENSGWLEIYQKQQVEIADLRAEVNRLRSIQAIQPAP